MRRYNNSINPHKLYRNPDKGVFGGVCAGIAEYFVLSTRLVRVLFVIGFLLSNILFLIGYVTLVFVLEKRPLGINLTEDESDFWKGVAHSPRSTLSELKFKFMKMEEKIKKMENYVTSSEYDLEKKYRNL